MIEEQPRPDIFFKVFLELNFSSMLPFLAFDSLSIQTLLGDNDKNRQHFTELSEKHYPIFFRNRTGRSAIDQALEDNQLASVNLMVAYVCKYQNSHSYFHLFENNLVTMVERDV